jgi:hypothetical protein
MLPPLILPSLPPFFPPSSDSFSLKVDDDYTNIYDAWWAMIDINNEMFRDTGTFPMNL